MRPRKTEGEAFKAAERERRRAMSQRRKRRGVEDSYDRACDLIRRALDEDQDGYRLAPDLEKEMLGALRHQESRKAAECAGNARGASTSEDGVRVPERPSMQRLVEFIIGPCTRERAERFAQDMQEHADTDFPDLGAAVAIDFSLEQDTKSAPTQDRGDD